MHVLLIQGLWNTHMISGVLWASQEVIRCDSTTYSFNFIIWLSLSHHSTTTPVKTHAAGCRLHSPAAGTHHIFMPLFPLGDLAHQTWPVCEFFDIMASCAWWMGSWSREEAIVRYCCQHAFPFMLAPYSKKCFVGGTQLQHNVTASAAQCHRIFPVALPKHCLSIDCILFLSLLCHLWNSTSFQRKTCGCSQNGWIFWMAFQPGSAKQGRFLQRCLLKLVTFVLTSSLAWCNWTEPGITGLQGKTTPFIRPTGIAAKITQVFRTHKPIFKFIHQERQQL